LFNTRSERLASQTLRNRVPAIYHLRDFAATGGLMRYGGSIIDAYQIVGAFTGRILKGDNPADLSVQNPTKSLLILNLKTAKTLGLTVPPGELAIADEVIE
jgi:putative ABC transport system substrate-binding protein